MTITQIKAAARRTNTTADVAALAGRLNLAVDDLGDVAEHRVVYAIAKLRRTHKHVSADFLARAWSVATA